MKQHALESIFVLHTRPYRETSVLLEVFSQHYGRLALVARGARTKTLKTRKHLPLFQHLAITWSGKGELLSLNHCEMVPPCIILANAVLPCGLYLNELMIKLLAKHDPHPVIFTKYAQAITSLAENQFIERTLRIFEAGLLKELGYAPDYLFDLNGEEIQPENDYLYSQEQGFSLVTSSAEKHALYKGEHLLAIANNDFNEQDTLSTAKRLFRSLILYLLGANVLRSRELWVYT